MNPDHHSENGPLQVPLSSQQGEGSEATGEANQNRNDASVRGDPSSSPDEPKLPDLNEAVLDAATLEQLFRDLEACVQITEIIPKLAERRMVTDQTSKLTLAQARELLLSGKARGIQIRYRYEGADWWDTLMQTPQGVRLVRIRHEFD